MHRSWRDRGGRAAPRCQARGGFRPQHPCPARRGDICANALEWYTGGMAKRATSSDPRPPVAVGHVFLEVRDVPAAGQWCEAVGMRRIFTNENVAVLELRGGT